jgi:hypothetical protein
MIRLLFFLILFSFFLFSTARVVDALIKANKRFDLMILPGQVHLYGEATPYLDRLMWYYFAEHLLGITGIMLISLIFNRI